MSKHKSDGKKKKKGSQFVIRLDKDERDAFVALCDTLDTSAAREIRRFMRDWVAANSPKPEAGAEADAAVEPAAAEALVPAAEAEAEVSPDAAPEAKPKVRRKAAAK